MAKKFYLKIETMEGVLTLPFKNIESLDKFTVHFKDSNELVSSLIKALRLSFRIEDVLNVYLSDDEYNRERTIDSLPVKYIGNNFNFSSLQEAFVKFLCNDYRRIFSHPIRFMRDERLLEIVNTGVVDQCSVENVVRKYFASNNDYKKRRDTYFHIIDMDKSGEIEIANNPFVDEDESEQFSGFNIIEPKLVNCGDAGGVKWENELVGYLYVLAQRLQKGDEAAMDELGGTDVGDLYGMFEGDRPVVDGALTKKQKNQEIILLLEEHMGMEFDEILKHTSLSRRQMHYGRRRYN